MEISYRISRKGSNDYWMDYFGFILKVEDLPDKLRQEVSQLQLWRIMQFIMIRETVMAQVTNGFMEMDEAMQRMAFAKEQLGPLLEKVVEYAL